MCSYKVIVVLAIIVFVLVLDSNCRQLGHSSLKRKHGQKGLNGEESDKVSDEAKSLNTTNQQPTATNQSIVTKNNTKNVAHNKASQRMPEKNAKKKSIAHHKLGIKKKREENKAKKFALSYSPGSQAANYQQQPTNVGYSPEAATQQQYFTSRFAGQSQNEGQESQQQLEQQQQERLQQQQQQQQGYPMTNSAEEQVSKYQDPNSEQQGDNNQNFGMLQSLMEQRAAMFGQQEGNQDAGQRSYRQQQVASYQGQQNGPQEDTQQYQQGYIQLLS